MLYLDNNAEIRDLFREVEGVSQHGLDELFDQDGSMENVLLLRP